MTFLALDALVDLLSVNSDILGCIDSNPDLVAFHAQDGHRNFVADHHGLADTPSQYQHNRTPSFPGTAATTDCFKYRIAIKRSFEAKAADITYHRGDSSINPRQEYKNPKRNCCNFISE
jgi:hypothetical protein